MATYNLKQLWTKACEQDGIDPDSKFVVFSKDNKWAEKYNNLAYVYAALPNDPDRKPAA